MTLEKFKFRIFYHFTTNNLRLESISLPTQLCQWSIRYNPGCLKHVFNARWSFPMYSSITVHRGYFLVENFRGVPNATLSDMKPLLQNLDYKNLYRPVLQHFILSSEMKCEF